MRDARELELLQLKQGFMTITEYTRKFEELCRFTRICQGAPESYEGWKCIKYQGGLKKNIMSVVAPLEIRQFSELVNNVRVVEEYAKKTALATDTRGGTSNKGRGKYFPLRGQNLKKVDMPFNILKVKKILEGLTMTYFIRQEEEIYALIVDYLDTLLRITLVEGIRMRVRTSNKAVCLLSMLMMQLGQIL
ncbi:hypothetical protein AHAS_Ahas04G0119000 [Arachis hypogaea]